MIDVLNSSCNRNFYDQNYIGEVTDKLKNEIEFQEKQLSANRIKYIDKDNYIWTLANLVEKGCRCIFISLAAICCSSAVFSVWAARLTLITPILEPFIWPTLVISAATGVPLLLISLTSRLWSPYYNSFKEYLQRPEEERKRPIIERMVELRKYIELIQNAEELNNQKNFKDVGQSYKIIEELCQNQPSTVEDIVNCIIRCVEGKPSCFQVKSARKIA